MAAGNDMLAIGCYAALDEVGLNCPADLSVVGFNDMPFIDRLRPPLTTIRFPHYQVGTEAAQLLLERIAGHTGPVKVLFLAPELVVRGSTGPPGGAAVACPPRARPGPPPGGPGCAARESPGARKFSGIEPIMSVDRDLTCASGFVQTIVSAGGDLMAGRGNELRLGWLGTGRMGVTLVRRLLEAGCDVAVYNRTRAKAEPLAELGAKIVSSPAELSGRDIVFATVGTPQDLIDAVLGEDGLATGESVPAILVDCSTISAEVSMQIREQLAARGTELLAAPVMGNPKVGERGEAHPRRVRAAGRVRRRPALPGPARRRGHICRRGRTRPDGKALP